MFIANRGLCSITLYKLFFYGQLGLIAVAIGLFLYRGLVCTKHKRTQEREKTQQAKPRGIGTDRKMKSDTGKKDFEIYIETHSDWGFCSILA